MAKKKSKKKDGKAEKAEAEKAKKAAKKQAAAEAAKAAKADKKAAKAAKKAGGQQDAAPAPAAAQPDQVELLKLALRDTEAKLVDAEHRLRQVQQQLDDERKALAQAADAAAEEAVLDDAVSATVADAVLGAELAAATAPEDLAAADLAEAVAETLDQVVTEANAPAPAPAGDAAVAAAVFATDGTGAQLTPPLPHRPAEDQPSEAWTLVRLREEARRRGIAGASNLPKSELVERLQRA